MTIQGIRNPFLRRAVLLVAFVPIVLISALLVTLEVVWEVVCECSGAFAEGWRGR